MKKEQKTADGWNPEHLPSQKGKSIIITGGTSGIGYESALALCSCGADVTIAARNPEKGNAVIGKIISAYPDSQIQFMELDTSDQNSVHCFSEKWLTDNKRIDTLILNAGISNVPNREITSDGFERQLATNYLGHFALTAMLFPAMQDSSDARIIATSSLAHKRTTLNLDDLQLKESYTPMKGYAQSKLAVLTFILELARRLKDSGCDIKAIPIHPGVAATDITRGGDKASPIRHRFAKTMFGIIGQSAKHGAYPILYAATSEQATSGIFYGPSGAGERKGLPAKAKIAPFAQDRETAIRLWDESEKLTGVSFLLTSS
ncbi:MAG: SDR family NAD(P)-dependent oxidoreductase [Ruminococcus sp.]|nr:SDR family NAD(P)-dependent oxidoreductase [Ruminococcus sp.]